MPSSIRNRIACAAALFLTLVASGCAGRADYPKFDGQAAYQLLKRQCDFGPRPLGSSAHERIADFLAAEMRKSADQTLQQPFTYDSPSRGRKFTGRNIIGVFGKNKPRWILLLAHYDTRPTADEEIDEAKAKQPIIGANDGASGCAVLLELARMFCKKPPAVGIVMLFTDGEDFGPSPNEMFIGSREFAEKYREVMKPVKDFKDFEYGILLDMVGDKDLRIRKEFSSNRTARNIVEKVWKAANDLGYENYFSDDEPELKDMIQDDHQSLLAVGVKCIDVIDFNYPYWHTLEDTPDKCGAKSLQTVGDVIARVVYSEPVGKPTSP